MIVLPLHAQPNQSFSTVLDGNRYDISIIETNGVMSATIIRNSVTIVENIRITAGTFLIPYRYLENGNFYMTNLNEEIIYYPSFGASQMLVYLTAQDLINIRGT